MEKVSNNIKFYTFVNILRTYSSEEVSLSIKDINEYMKEKLGVTLDRRTIYSYIKDMRQMGMKVSEYSKEKEGYFLTDSSFKEYELKLLMDSVKSSHFITQKQTEKFLKKISALSYIYTGKEIKSDVLINDTSKTTNEELYDNLNLITMAINKRKKITFNYVENHNFLDSQVISQINPICIVNDHKHYYLITNYNNIDKVNTYRVDNITSIKILEEVEDEKTSYDMNPSTHIKKTFEENIREYIENGGDHGHKY